MMSLLILILAIMIVISNYEYWQEQSAYNNCSQMILTMIIRIILTINNETNTHTHRKQIINIWITKNDDDNTKW